MAVPINKGSTPMPARELQKQLDELREQLEQNPPLSEPERENLHQLMMQLDAEIALGNKLQNAKLVDGVNLADQRLELDHPTIAGPLRHIAQALGNIGS